MILPVTAIPKPRMTRADTWKHRDCVVRYFHYKDDINFHLKKQKQTIQETFVITFQLPIPNSWSKKKKESFLGKPHQQKPDIDNLLKGFMDAVFDEDCAVWKVTASKYWAEKGSIEVN